MGGQYRESIRRFCLLSLLSLLSILDATAQISASIIESLETTIFCTRILDKDGKEPISFASVYLTEKKDSVICSYSLSDVNGEVKLPAVLNGEYILFVEHLGYEPFAQYVSSKNSNNGIKTLGTIRLTPQKERLAESVIIEKAQDVSTIKDTVIIHASLFHQSANDKLIDLLKKMPGFEISDFGISYYGKAIDNITVGGHTFFVNDPSIALNNLPAQIVQNVRIFPEAKRQIIDIDLKQEYLNSYFGSASLSAGYDNHIGINSSLLGSYFGDTANYTTAFSLQSLDDSFNTIIRPKIGGKEESVLNQRSGIEKDIVAGADIGGLITVSYKENYKRVLDSLLRISIYEDTTGRQEDIISGDTRARILSTTLRHARTTGSNMKIGASLGLDLEKDSESSYSTCNSFNGFTSDNLYSTASFNAYKTLENSGGSLSFVIASNISVSQSDGCDQNINWTKDMNSFELRGVGTFSYPLTNRVSLISRLLSSYNPIHTTRDADADQYSFSIRNNLADLSEYIGADWSVHNGGKFEAGVNSIQSHTGSWTSYLSPSLAYTYKNKQLSLSIKYDGRPNMPERKYLTSVIDITNPNYVLIGNDKLSSSFTHYGSSSLKYYGEKHSISFQLNYNLIQNPIIFASWYDESGRRNAHPINVNTPTSNYFTTLTFNSKFGPDNSFRIMLSPSFRKTESHGLLANSNSEISNIESFDLSSFYQWFNNPDTFMNTSTKSSVTSLNGSISWNKHGWSSSLHTKLQHYSLSWNTKIPFRRDLLNCNFGFEGGFCFPSEAEIKTQVEYASFKGYESNYARPSTVINLSISYPFRYCSAFIHGIDLLDQRNMFSQSIEPTYSIDTCSLIQGRTIIVGVIFNFGSRSTKTISAARGAALGILNN